MKKKASDIFEGPDSSLRKTFDTAVAECTCASFYTVREMHKVDCPLYLLEKSFETKQTLQVNL